MKTGRPVRFDLTDQTRQAIDEYLSPTVGKPGQFLLTGRDPWSELTRRRYARLIGEHGLDAHTFATH